MWDRSLAHTAKEWERRSQLVNFYGRFRPRLERGVPITADNYLSVLFTTVHRVGEKDEQEDCFNFLSGVARPEFAGGETWRIPRALNLNEAHRVTVLAFSRALALGILDQKPDDAIAEVSALRNCFSRIGEEMQDPLQIRFLLSLSHQLGQVQGYLTEKKTAFSSVDLPKSAESFLMYHPTLKKTKEIPDFRTLLAEKVRWYLAMDLFHNLKKTSFQEQRGGVFQAISGPSFSRIQTIIQQYEEGEALYRDVEQKDIPIYWEAKEKLAHTDARRLVVFGRDGRYFFTALKAGEFGRKEKEVKYLVVTSPIAEYHRKRLALYLQQHGVTLDFTFIDTGFRGSVPEAAIQSLANAAGVSISSREVDKRIKLLASSSSTRGELSKRKRPRSEQEGRIGVIEDRPKNIDRPEILEVDERGRVTFPKNPRLVDEQLTAWIVEHAVMRNFAPRLDAEKRIRYLDYNPLQGYTFLQEYHGSHIGTHPMQLWEGKDGKKILLKGGPSHALKADLVGTRFLNCVGIRVPEAELVMVDGEEKLKMEFLGEWETGGIKLPDVYHHEERIQEGFLVDALLGQYDRTPWNLMFREGYSPVFIDNGAALFSRARGGFKGFPEYIDAAQLAEILTNPQFPGEPVNEAYANLIEVKGDHIRVKTKYPLRHALNRLVEEITDETIDEIINEAQFADGEKSIPLLHDRIKKLEEELSHLSQKSKDYQMTAGAIKTFKIMIEVGGEATYLKHALRNRRDDLFKLFGKFSI